MATKHANVVTLSEGLPPINLQNPLNIAHVRSRDKSKLLYLHYHSAYVHKTDRVVTYSGELQWGGHVRSSGQLDTLYIHLKETYGY